MSSYATTAAVGAAGATLTLGDVALSIPAGAIADVTVGANETTGVTPVGSTALGKWYEIATSKTDLATTGAPLVLALKCTAPSGATNHPGLRIIAAVDGSTFPIDATYDSTSGTLRASLLGLPPRVRVQAVFDAKVQRLEDPALATPGRAAWSTLNWAIDFDGERVTLAQAKKVLGWAMKAAKAYQDAGFGEPFLYQDAAPLWGKRWHLHLTHDGSYFSGSHDPASADAVQRFGRQYLDVSRVESPASGDLGSGYASVAHELFHAIFFNAKVPYWCFDAVASDGTHYCYKSTAGFNEGMATAAGYALDQGTAKARPSETPMPPSWPQGYFSGADTGIAYRNQDFYVYLHRQGGLSAFAAHLAALTTTSAVAVANDFEALARYSAALDAAPTGLEGTFGQYYLTYAADRGYLRSADAQIWPRETTFGAAKLDPSMFPAMVRTVLAADCKVEGEASVCTLKLEAVPPNAGRVIEVNLSDPGVAMQVKTADFDAKVSLAGAKLGYYVFAEPASGEVRVLPSKEGGDVTVQKVGSLYRKIYIVLSQAGSASATIDATLRFATAALSEPCQTYADWMCKCGPNGQNLSALQCEAAVATMCANIQEGASCDELCAASAETFINAYSDPDPSLWSDYLHCRGPRA